MSKLRRQTRDPVAAELRRLGRLRSADAIAADLGRRRCKGVRGKPDGCPVAVRLRRVSGQKKLTVGPLRVNVWGGPYLTYPAPAAVTDFICNFDMGRYPTLVRKAGGRP